MNHDRLNTEQIARLEHQVIKGALGMDLSQCHQFDVIKNIRFPDWNKYAQIFGLDGPIQTKNNICDFSWFGQFRANLISPESYWTAEYTYYNVNIGENSGKLIRLSITQNPLNTSSEYHNKRGLHILRLNDQAVFTYIHPDFDYTQYMIPIGENPIKYIHPFILKMTRDLSARGVNDPNLLGMKSLNETLIATPVK